MSAITESTRYFKLTNQYKAIILTHESGIKTLAIAEGSEVLADALVAMRTDANKYAADPIAALVAMQTDAKKYAVEPISVDRILIVPPLSDVPIPSLLEGLELKGFDWSLSCVKSDGSDERRYVLDVTGSDGKLHTFNGVTPHVAVLLAVQTLLDNRR